MRGRLGERADYSRYGHPLGRAVHRDAAMLLRYVAEPGFRFDGLGTSWPDGPPVQRAQVYPRDSLLEEIDARSQRERDVRRLMDAVDRLREYDPVLHHALFACCIVGEHRFLAGRGLRHIGEMWERLLRGVYGGRAGALWRDLEAGWRFVAILVVSSEVLEAAEAAGAVSERALAWARARGVLAEGR